MQDLIAPSSKQSSTRKEWVLSGRLVDGGEQCLFPLSPLPFCIGRKSGLALTLPRSTVSSVHAEFFETDQGLFIGDLGSTNGTFVNGTQLEGRRQVHNNDLIQFADMPFRLAENDPNSGSHTQRHNSCDQAIAVMQLDRLIAGGGAVPFYQPIVDLRTNRTVGYEVLSRSRLIGLENPKSMFLAADQMGLTVVLSEKLRSVGVDGCDVFSELPHLYLNTHPCELETESLLESCAELRRSAPQQRITIEIHESAVTNPEEMLALRSGLDALDMRLAFDDFGAGQARIAELLEVRPEVIKFDRSMIKNLHASDAAHRRFVAGLVAIVRDLGIVPLAEGVETREENDACIESGFLLCQGFFHGRPMPPAHYIK